VWSPEIISRPS